VDLLKRVRANEWDSGGCGGNRQIFIYQGRPAVQTVIRDITQRKKSESRFEIVKSALEPFFDQGSDWSGTGRYARPSNYFKYSFISNGWL